MSEIKERALSLLRDGTVVRVLGWRCGEFCYEREPAFFHDADELQEFVYDGFCGANLSKYLIEASKLEGKTLVFLKPCDSYSCVELLKEHRISRDKFYVIGVGCKGKLDPRKFHDHGIKGVLGIDNIDEEQLTVHTLYADHEISYKELMLDRCHVCHGKEHRIADEVIGTSEDTTEGDRFAEVAKVEAMSPEERFAFFQKELSRCIRCNACRNVCPACSCRKCVFDSEAFDSSQKANVDSFEEKMFHIIRAFHVAGRCTDCGECSRVCPQQIPLHLFNRKFIREINDLYGTYQAGEVLDEKSPLTSFTLQDAEPSVISGRK